MTRKKKDTVFIKIEAFQQLQLLILNNNLSSASDKHIRQNSGQDPFIKSSGTGLLCRTVGFMIRLCLFHNCLNCLLKYNCFDISPLVNASLLIVHLFNPCKVTLSKWKSNPRSRFDYNFTDFFLYKLMEPDPYFA